MTEILNAGEKLLVFGLTWVSLQPSQKRFSQLALLIQNAGSKHYARYAGEVVKIGLLKCKSAVPADTRQGDMLAAAILFSNYIKQSRAPQNSILIHQFSDTQLGLVVLLRGMPYLDIVIEVDELENQINAVNSELHENFALYGNYAGSNCKTLTAETLMSGGCDAAALKTVANPWKKIKRISALAALLAVVSGGVAWKWDLIGKNPTAEKKPVDPLIAYEENIRQLLSRARFNGESAYQAVWGVIKNREVEVDGWSLKSIQCKPSQCDERWQKGHGSFSAFRSRLNRTQTLSPLTDGLTVLVSYPLKAGGTALERASLPKKSDIWAELLTQQQKLKQIHPQLSFTPKTVQVRGLNPPLLANSIPPDNLVYAGEMTITAPLGFAAEVLLHQMENIMVNEVELDSLGDVRNARIQIKGHYYAKN